MARLTEKWTKKLLRGLPRLFSVDHVVADYRKRLDRVGAIDRQNQLLLMHAYRGMNGTAPSWQDIEFRSFSQNGEDGVLLYLLTKTGMATRRSVEVGCGSGVECNTANLVINHGFRGLLLDARARQLDLGRRFYGMCRDTRSHQPRMVTGWVDRGNVDGLISGNGFRGEIDVLSIDVDGVDYWIWEAITCVEPRIVVIEYNARFAAEQSVTVRYEPNFVQIGPTVGGASLGALVKLAERKGYRLVGCNQHRINAFFVRDGVGEDVLPAADPRMFTRPDPADIPDGWLACIIHHATPGT